MSFRTLGMSKRAQKIVQKIPQRVRIDGCKNHLVKCQKVT